MERATEIQGAIKAVITGFRPFSDPEKSAVIGREQAALISEAVFEVLEAGGYLGDGPATDRRFRITLIITEAIGNADELPGNHRPGHWRAQSRPGWDPDEFADAIYANLAHAGHMAKG